MMITIVKHALKILRCDEQREILKVCLTIFHHYT